MQRNAAVGEFLRRHQVLSGPWIHEKRCYFFNKNKFVLKKQHFFRRVMDSPGLMIKV
jgi:hypothetical protein